MFYDLRRISEVLKKSNRKSRHKLIIAVALSIISLIFLLLITENHAQSKSESYVLGKQGGAVVAGTKSGNASIWPITHPAFIVSFFPTKISTANQDGYRKTVDSIKSVIPYANSNALWICSNTLSEYLEDKGFNTKKQVYKARRSSLNGSMMLYGGVNDPETTKSIIDFDASNRTNKNPAPNGVFYQNVLGLYIKNNRNFAALSKDPDFAKLLEKPSAAKIDESLKVWSFITDTNTQGTSSTGYTYTVDIKKNMEEFMNYNSFPKRFLVSNWVEERKTNYDTKGIDSNGKLKAYSITVIEELDLRYLDLLMTLNAMANNRTYWQNGIKSYMKDNKGEATLSITHSMVARLESLSTKGGDVEPATVFVSSNDLTQTAYNVKSDFNLSDLIPSKKVAEIANSKVYNKRLKKAVELSKPSTYKNTGIYSTAIISRILSEEVRKVKDGKLVWGDSYNDAELIKLLRFQVDENSTPWYGTNWALEPPIAGSTVNYGVKLQTDSTVYNTINKKTGPLYDEKTKNINLRKYYELKDSSKLQDDTVPTDDTVKVQVLLNALNIKGEKPGEESSIKEWDTFIKQNNISNFRVKILLYRDNNGTKFDTLSDKKYTQIHTGTNTWCTSNSWVKITANDMKELLRGKKAINQWVDTSIASMLVREEDGEKAVKYAARVYIQYQAQDKKWYYTTGKADTDTGNLVISSKNTTLAEVRQSNNVYHKYKWNPLTPTTEDLDYPTDSWSSKEPSLAYAEMKEGTIYNETFEAMAGVPSTRTLYFSSGGNEFMADLQVNYEHDTTAIREYITHYNGTECEYKENDKLIGGTGKYSENLTFVGDSTGKTISKSITAESSQIATPEGNSSGNITVSGHTSETTLWAEWTGSIDNGTQEPSDSGSFDAGKAGTPCAGKDFDVGKLRTKKDPSTDWKVDAYNKALEQATKWATDMEATNSSYTVQKIADSDGQARQYKVGNAVITITLTGGSNGYTVTTPRSYGGGTYSSSSASAASLNSNDKGKLGSGWGWSPGKLGFGSGYSDCGHGHGATGWHTAPIAAVPPDKDGNGGRPAVPGVEHTHNCGSFTDAVDITQGASGTINYTIKVTFQNGTLTSSNSDGNAADVAATTKTGLSSLPAHALCGPCCAHDLPAIEDAWSQDLTYDTIKITKSNVYKLQNGYVTEMSNITYDGKENIIAGITQGDPNIFYNIAAYNNPAYNADKKLTNGSQIGRIRYSLQEAQGDKVYYEEMSSGEYKRTNKCDGLAKMQSPMNPAPPAKTGHELGYASGILYSNGKTAGFGTAPAVNITTEDFLSDNTATVATPKTAYGNKLDSRDLTTEEWKRFYTRRTQPVTATVISDMLILQTSSGDQSPVYYEENTKAVKAQEDFNSLQASGDVKKASTQEQVDAKWNKMWTNNATTFAKAIETAINVGSYNGKYDQTSSKYKGTGDNARIATRFDNDISVFSSPKDELGLARVTSNQTFTRPAYGTSNIASPGKAQARMNRENDLLLYIDKIKQNPTNSNDEYITGDSFVFYIPVLKYKVVGDTVVTVPEDAGESKNVGDGEENADDGTGDEDEIPDAFKEKESDILVEGGYHYGPGLIYESKYSAYDDNSDYKVNNFIVLNAVSAQDAMIVKSEVEDQRTEEGIVKDAMETLKALEKCPGTPALCEYRVLNCKYTLDTTSLSFNFDKKETENVFDDDASGTADEYITNNIVNTDGAHTTYKLPEGFTLTSGDETYSGFGTGQFLKVAGAGTSLNFSYNDCKIYLTPASRVRVSADIYIPAAPASNTMLFSIGGVGLYLPANTGSPVFITSTGEKRTSSANILGRKVKVVATFSLGSLYDCELSIDGTKVIAQITTGLTEAQIAAAAIDETMRGEGLNIGCWEYNTSYATNFYTDNIVITRCGGTLEHTASCYTTYKKANPVYQDLYNGISNKAKEVSSKVYNYTGNVQSVTLDAGTYMLEAFGASGGNGRLTNTETIVPNSGGKGGYSSGTVTFTKQTTLYIVAGGKGSDQTSLDYQAFGQGGYNGGGNGGADMVDGTSPESGAGGGGATDIRLSAPSVYRDIISSVNPNIGKFADNLNASGSTGKVSVVKLPTGESALKYTAGSQHLAANLTNVFVAGHTYKISFEAWTTAASDVLHVDAHPDTLPQTDFTISSTRKTYTTTLSSNLNEMNGAYFRIFASGEIFSGDVYVTNIRVYDTNQTVSTPLDYDSLASRILIAGGGGGAISYLTNGSADGYGGDGGGSTGTTLNSAANEPGTQTTGYTLGQGQNGLNSYNTTNTGNYATAGNGGGYYGGKVTAAQDTAITAGSVSINTGGAGGSGYIAETLTNTMMTTGVNNGNGYVKITKISSVDWAGVFNDGSYGVVSNYSKHVHDASCLTISSEGYQIALAEAKAGDWTDLKKELGTELFNKVVTNFNININAGNVSNNVDGNTSRSATIDTETEKVTQTQTVPSGTAYNFGYTGSYQTFTAPASGTYKLEVWGAQGGTAPHGGAGGLGGYSTGTINLTANQSITIYVGGMGNTIAGGWNGGGNTGFSNPDGAGGGGATDIRVDGNALSNRIIVAGGGGGSGCSNNIGGAGGGTVGYAGSGNNYGTPGGGGTQTTGGYSANGSSGSLGQGGNAYSGYDWSGGGGGGGYYGGGAGQSQSGGATSGGGGSGYIGGVSNGSMSTGIRSGNGYATITLQSGGTVTSYETVISNTTVQNPTGVVKAGQTYTYGYTGGVQAITLPAGTYQLEAFGAAGGGNTASGTSRGSRGGKGGYTSGTVTLKETTTLYIYVGEKGTTNTGTAAGGWNGGGNAVWASTTKIGAGGGATDFRITAGNWNDLNSLKSRILVAGGGGGSDDIGEASGAYHSKQPGTYSTPLANDNDETGGAGGGINGGGAVTSGYEANYGYGTQTGGGTAAAGGVNGGFGYGGANTNSAADYGGGGGGYYGGASGGGAYQGGAGGASYVSGYTGCDTTYRANQKYAAFTNVTLQQGVRAGNGYAKVTVLDVKTIPEDNELFNFIKANMNLIPDKVTTGGVTIVNPIWNCKTRNNTGITYTEQTILTCTEPHHSGGHYDYASDICWDPCGNDENHKHTKLEVIDANGTKVQQATYITLDNFFKIYFPNAGDFQGNDSYGILQPSVYRGKGYKQGMDTTEWTREKYVKFDFDVLYERRGVWESYPAGNWIPLEIIDAATTRKYALTDGTKLTIDGNTYVFDRANGLMRCNGGSTTLIEGNNMAVMNGKIFVLNSDGTVNVSDPCKEYNFYCLLENNEHTCVEAQFAVEGINYDGQSTTEDPYSGNDSYEDEYDIYYYGNTYSTNKDRFNDFTANHTAAKMAYLDVIGRIGNLIVEDSDDMRFSNYFKKSIAETNEDWLVQGIISRVDSSISEHYLSWHRNTAGYPLAVDVRGEQVSKEKGYYNTWGAQEWTTKAESSGLSLSADKNSKSILQKEQLKLGYNVLFDVTTMGDYNQYLQVIPYFYALNKTSGELTPVDVYINNDGNTQPINYFGLYSEYMDDNGNYKEGYDTLVDKLYKYTMYLNWTDEAARRNYTAGGKEASNTDAVRDYFIEPVRDSEGEITTYKYLTVPFGNFYNLGSLQCLQPGVRARTFVGSSQISAIKEQASRLGITANGINGGIETNLDNEFVSEMFYHQAQRWHLSIGVPSSSTFVAYREKGIHLAPEDNWYVASYVEDGVTKTKQFSKAFLTASVADKEYDVGTAFLISGTEYTITNEYQAGKEYNDNDDYVILMTADIKAIGDEWNLKYSTGNDNGYITVDGTTYTFDGTIPTFIAAYDTKSSLVDISTQHTH